MIRLHQRSEVMNPPASAAQGAEARNLNTEPCHRDLGLFLEGAQRARPASAPPLPYQRWRHPPGCPDGDWCRGNGVCYWDCHEG